MLGSFTFDETVIDNILFAPFTVYITKRRPSNAYFTTLPATAVPDKCWREKWVCSTKGEWILAETIEGRYIAPTTTVGRWEFPE